MTVLGTVAARLSRQDMLQGLTAILAILCVALTLRWPGPGTIANDSWALIGPLRSLLLGLAAIAWGAAVGVHHPVRGSGRGNYDRSGEPSEASLGSGSRLEESWATLGGLMAMAALTTPFDALAHAGSYPRVGIGWALTAPVLVVLGHFGLGLFVGRVSRWARVGALLPLLVPAVVAFTVWLDIRVGASTFSAWFAPLGSSLVLAALSLLVAGAGMAMTARSVLARR